MRNYHFQASLEDPSAKQRVLAKLEALRKELTTIGASARVRAQTHDDVEFILYFPKGFEAQAKAILHKHFPPRSTP